MDLPKTILAILQEHPCKLFVSELDWDGADIRATLAGLFTWNVTSTARSVSASRPLQF